MQSSWFLLLLAVQYALAFPFLANMPGVDPSLMARGVTHNVKRQTTCPNNPNHQGAAPYNPTYPYTGARNGLPGTQVGNVKVPADGDTAHQFVAPGPLDIRGPCPGLNTMANHNFISHDGITTISELVDAQQNAFNMAFDLSVFLATLGVGLSGDPVTLKVSLGCDATSRTSALGLGLLGAEQGLNSHNKFENDASLTRNDYFLNNGDDYTFNGTLFKMMQNVCQGNCNHQHLALFRQQRYQESRATNPNFLFPPLAIGLYGAASTIYRVMAGNGIADVATMKKFWGAADDGNGGYVFNNQETFPPNWYNIPQAYTLSQAVVEMATMIADYPVIFGGNAGVNNFIPLTVPGGLITNGVFTSPKEANVLCLLYQAATNLVPNSLSLPVTTITTIITFIAGKLNGLSNFANAGCPLV